MKVLKKFVVYVNIFKIKFKLIVIFFKGMIILNNFVVCVIICLKNYLYYWGEFVLFLIIGISLFNVKLFVNFFYFCLKIIIFEIIWIKNIINKFIFFMINIFFL